MNRPIGIFDSGVGGFTVLREIRSLMPYEDIIYFGDTARVPYGSKSKETVIKYSEEILEFLIDQEVKYIIVACNTASAHALEKLKDKTNIPIMGVIEPGVDALIRKKIDSHIVALIATPGTIKSRAYNIMLNKKRKNIVIHSKACPLFVSLIEENILDHKITEEIIKFYLNDFYTQEIFTLVLGCTHYPILKDIILRLYPNFDLIDSSKEVANALKSELKQKSLLNDQNERGKTSVYVSDLIENFIENGNIFLDGEQYSLTRQSLSN